MTATGALGQLKRQADKNEERAATEAGAADAARQNATLLQELLQLDTVNATLEERLKEER